MLRNFLLVDDDNDEAELFTEAMLTVDSTINVKSYQNPQATIEELIGGALQPDIIFLDVNMPELTGWEFLGLLQEYNKLSDIPVVIYSTSSVAFEGQKALQNGALCFLEKPATLVNYKRF